MDERETGGTRTHDHEGVDLDSEPAVDLTPRLAAEVPGETLIQLGRFAKKSVQQKSTSALSRLKVRVQIDWEGEAPAEPQVPDSVVPGSRLSRSFALPPRHFGAGTTRSVSLDRALCTMKETAPEGIRHRSCERREGKWGGKLAEGRGGRE